MRERMLARRRELSPSVRDELSRAMSDRLLQLPEWHAARSVALFFSLAEEVATTALRRSAEDGGKRIFYPRCEARRSLAFVPIDHLTSWFDGPFGIQEPDGDSVPVSEIDLVVVPLVAFDRRGGRLGYGAGFYDRALAEYSGSKVGVAMGLQEASAVPQTETDVPLDLIVTDSEVIRPRVS